jgi:hypothetical protein
MAIGNYGLRRRGEVDPFSTAARFPSLTQDATAQAQSTMDAIRQAGAQHTLAEAGGANSIAARNDPLRYGSVFARENPGVLDAFRAQENAAAAPDAGGIQRRLDAPTEPSATDRYAARFGYDTPTAPAAAPPALGAPATTSPSSYTPGRLQRRLVNGIPTYDY